MYRYYLISKGRDITSFLFELRNNLMLPSRLPKRHAGVGFHDTLLISLKNR